MCSNLFMDEDGLPCAVPYSFKHSLPLVDDAEAFRVSTSRALQCNCNSKVHMSYLLGVFLLQNTVLREISSYNLDLPEGGWDGLVQVMACKDVCLRAPHPL